MHSKVLLAAVTLVLWVGGCSGGDHDENSNRPDAGYYDGTIAPDVTPCEDADDDGVCDFQDVCPGHDDTVDADADGVPDGCDLCPGHDDTVDTDSDGIADGCDNCPEVSNALQEDSDGMAAVPIPFAAEAAGGAILTTSTDVSLGFDFVFFGQTFDQIHVNRGGFLAFVRPNWWWCDGIPETETPNGVIALSWLGYGYNYDFGAGSLTYETRGAAPNRRFVATFDNAAPPASLDPTATVTTQAILYENTNVIEVHTTVQNTGGNGPERTRGLENLLGTLAAILPGERDTSFALSNDSVRFTTDSAADGVGDACANVTDQQYMGVCGC